jgi:hypothetical protein
MAVLTLTDKNNESVAQHYSPEILMSGWSHLAIQLRADGSSGTGVTFKIWGTLDPDAPTPSDLQAKPDASWSDVTMAMCDEETVTIGADEDESELYVEDKNVQLAKYIIQYMPTNATNTTKILIRKY